MDFERLINQIVEKTGAEAKRTGEDEDLEHILTFTIDEDRKQEVVIYPMKEEGKEIVRLISFIAKKELFSANKLISFLELNMSLRFGAFAIYQGHVVLVTTGLYSSVVDTEKVIDLAKYIVKMADNFERSLIGLDKS